MDKNIKLDVSFTKWLEANYNFTDKTIKDILSRVKRANKITKLEYGDIYIQRLERKREFSQLKSSVKSQIKKAVKLYDEFYLSNNKFKVLSLFSNIGIAETYLSEIGFEVVIANEIDQKRCEIYKDLYEGVQIIQGDITEDEVSDKIVDLSNDIGIDVIIMTPPCQGISTAGKNKKFDERNNLVCYGLDVLLKIKPKYAFIENVIGFFTTNIFYNEEVVTIEQYIENTLHNDYIINKYNVNMADYGIPQMRERSITLLTRKDMVKEWEMPLKEEKIVTLQDILGDLPSIDPLIYDIPYEEHLKIFPLYEERRQKALEISYWNEPPKHVYRQVVAMQHTPTGCTAFDNEIFYPVKKDGSKVKGYKNTYKRQSWDKPAYTITMYNNTISSQNNVHPGRKMQNGLYSDPRVLTTYELMLCMSLPHDWKISRNISSSYLRGLIGEGIPPMFVKKIFLEIIGG